MKRYQEVNPNSTSLLFLMEKLDKLGRRILRPPTPVLGTFDDFNGGIINWPYQVVWSDNSYMRNRTLYLLVLANLRTYWPSKRNQKSSKELNCMGLDNTALNKKLNGRNYTFLHYFKYRNTRVKIVGRSCREFYNLLLFIFN